MRFIDLWYANCTFDEYDRALNKIDHTKMSPEQMVDAVIHIYHFRSPIKAKVKELRDIMDYGERWTLQSLVRILEEKTGDAFGNDLDAWIEKYADDTSKRHYAQAKEQRNQMELPTNPLRP